MIWLWFIGTVAISLLASARVKSTYLRYSRIPGGSGLSGAEAAQEIMGQAGIDNVETVAVAEGINDLLISI